MGLFFLYRVKSFFRLFIFPEWRAVNQARFVKHPVYGTFQKPNLRVRRLNPPNYDVINRTNALGFRDREAGFEQDLAGIWWAGASNSFGGFVQDNEVAAARLQARGWPVANLASEGHRLPNQLKVMKHLYGLGHRPRAILIEMTLTNALADHARHMEQIPKPLAEIAKSPKDLARPGARQVFAGQIRRFADQAEVSWIGIKSRFLNNNAIYSWLKVGVNSIPVLHELTLNVGLRSDVALASSTPVGLLRRGGQTPHDNLITSTADYVAALQIWLEKNMGAKTGFILIPSHHQMNAAYFKRYTDHLGVDAKTLDVSRPYRRLLQELGKRGVPVLGMEKPMKASKDFLSFPDDGHLNALGHDILAREAAGWLQKKFGIRP